MQKLNLDTSVKSFLTRTEKQSDPTDPTQTIDVSYLCDLQGNRLPAGTPGIPIYKDIITGKTAAMVCEKIPSAPDSVSQERAKEINALNPVFFTDNNVTGYFVVAPDFNNREGVQPKPAAAAAQQPAA